MRISRKTSLWHCIGKAVTRPLAIANFSWIIKIAEIITFLIPNLVSFRSAFYVTHQQLLLFIHSLLAQLAQLSVENFV